MNTPYALILTDSTHAPTVIGHYNSRQTIDEIRSAIRSYFTDDEPVLPTDIIPGTAQVLNECRAASRLIFERQNAASPFITTQSAKERLNQK